MNLDLTFTVIGGVPPDPGSITVAINGPPEKTAVVFPWMDTFEFIIGNATNAPVQMSAVVVLVGGETGFIFASLVNDATIVAPDATASVVLNVEAIQSTPAGKSWPIHVTGTIA